jgi:hypothetical protein
MGDEEPQYKCEYLDGEEGEAYNWAKRPGKVRITYANGSTFEGPCDTLCKYTLKGSSASFSPHP